MNFTNTRYPNLELLVYKATELLRQDEAVMAKRDALKKTQQFADFHFDVIVFPQTWGSTCTGFDVTKDGRPNIGGCAITEAYTTVVHERLTDTYIVFFGDQPCYQVTDANDVFFTDLNNRSMASLSEAMKRY